jgi:hypothetical protein
MYVFVSHCNTPIIHYKHLWLIPLFLCTHKIFRHNRVSMRCSSSSIFWPDVRACVLRVGVARIRQRNAVRAPPTREREGIREESREAKWNAMKLQITRKPRTMIGSGRRKKEHGQHPRKGHCPCSHTEKEQ